MPSEAGLIPNFNAGFGRVDLERAITVPDPGVLEFHDENAQLYTGQSYQLPVVVPNNAKALKVTLVWTDPPGYGLQNDLDLVVVAIDGQERHGNMHADSNGFDRRNNVEQVLWVNCPVGQATVAVRAYDFAVNSQSFALVLRVE